MFIAITTPQNPLRLENTLRPYKRGEQPFTPETAQQILESTNHKKNIYDTLQLIANLPKEQQADYKEIILSAFDHREQPTDTILLGKKLAVANGFEDELNAILTHDPMQDTINNVIYASASNQIAAVISADENPDFSQYPEDIALICTNDDLHFLFYDFSKVKSIKFKEGAKAEFVSCENLPQILDFSALSRVNITYANLINGSEIIFRPKSFVSLERVTNLPQKIDVSKCPKASFIDCDLIQVKSLLCPENGKLHLSSSRNIPANTDFSVCHFVSLYNSHFQTGKKIAFGKNSQINLDYARNLPQIVDVSQCESVSFKDTETDSAETIVFSSPAQMQKSQINPALKNKITILNPQPAPTRSFER